MNECIICGNSSGFGMICEECKGTIKFAKEIRKSLQSEKQEEDNPFYVKAIIGTCPNCGRKIYAGQSLCACGMKFVYA